MSSNIHSVNCTVSDNELYKIIDSLFENEIYVNKLKKFIVIISKNIQQLTERNVRDIVRRIHTGINNKDSKTVILEFDSLLYVVSHNKEFFNIRGHESKISWTYIKSHQSTMQMLLDLSEKNQKVINFCEVGAGKGFMSLKYIIAFHLLDIDYVGDFYEINDEYIDIFNKLFKDVKNVNVSKEDILLVDYSKYDYIYSYCPFTNPILEFILERRLFLMLKPDAFLYINGDPHYIMSHINSKMYSTYTISQNIIKILLPKNYQLNELVFFDLLKTNDKLKIMHPKCIFQFGINTTIISKEDLKKYLFDFKYKDLVDEIFYSSNENTRSFDFTAFIDSINDVFSNINSIEELHNYIIKSTTLSWFQKMILLELDIYSINLKYYDNHIIQKLYINV